MENALLIWGGSSSIGKELIQRKIEECDIIIATEEEKRYQELEAFVNGLPKRNTITILQKADVTRVEDIQKVMEMVEEEKIILNQCTYTVGINKLVPAVQVSEQDWDQIMDINLKGCFFVCQAVGRHMIKYNGGTIATVASQHGVVANYDRAPYCASKAGMIHLAKELALEWAKFHIRINVVSPTFIIQEQNEEYLESHTAKRKYLKNIPLREYATPAQVADTLEFLLSNQSAMVTGQNILVDGGWTIQ